MHIFSKAFWHQIPTIGKYQIKFKADGLSKRKILEKFLNFEFVALNSKKKVELMNT